MKRIAFVLLIFAAMTASASAYIFTFEVPSTIYKGEDIYIEGSGNLPAGTTMQLVLYQQKGTISEIERNSITIQDDGYWETNFETSDLDAGKYKIEVPSEYSTNLGSSSTSYQMFEIVDRSSEITITSYSEQKYNGYLDVSGRCATRGDAGVQLLVEGPYGIVFPQQWISTDSKGYFSQSVPIETEGSFEASFSDNDGLIDTVSFEVIPGAMTPRSSSISTASPTETVSVMQAQAFSSFGSPAYFTVETNPGILDIYTSSGRNWVICYVGEDLAEFTVNKYDDDSAEKVSIPVEGGIVYVKVFPADDSESGYVTLYAEGASSIKVSSDAEEYFSTPTEEESQQSGPEMWISLISACVAFMAAGFVVKR